VSRIDDDVDGLEPYDPLEVDPDVPVLEPALDPLLDWVAFVRMYFASFIELLVPLVPVVLSLERWMHPVTITIGFEELCELGVELLDVWAPSPTVAAHARAASAGDHTLLIMLPPSGQNSPTASWGCNGYATRKLRLA
jgi:hypothetical protein